MFFSKDKNDGAVIKLENSMECLLDAIKMKLGIPVSCVHNADGALVDDIDLIRDNDELYVTCEQSSKTNATSNQFNNTINAVHNGKSDWVRLNVGGKYFVTTKSTLVGSFPDSMLERMFSDHSGYKWFSAVDETGAYLIDRSPSYFEPILNFLRHGQLILDTNVSAAGVLEEAKFYGLSNLVEILEKRVVDDEIPGNYTPIGRRDFVLRLMAVPTSSELRCQGIDFSECDLSKLDLRNINFRYAILKHANLAGSNLTECNFERADLSHATLDGAKLIGARMLCVNLEGASLKNCYFEDPAGKQAYLEGANLKYVNLEGSCMAGINLRVATLRKANLQNCDLRGAILAGADLEDADLTGSDLQEANLRGANLNGAYLELIVNPLHMSQTIQGR